MSYVKRFIAMLLLTMVLSSVGNAVELWVKIDSRIANLEFNAVTTFDGEVILSKNIRGSKAKIGDLLMKDQIELKDGKIIYPSELHKALLTKRAPVNGRIPHSED